MQLLERLRRLEVEALQVEELVELSMIAKNLTTEFRHYDLEVPEWLSSTGDAIAVNIATRRREADTKALREIEVEELRLRSRDEIKTDLAAKKARLQARLGVAKPEPISA